MTRDGIIVAVAIAALAGCASTPKAIVAGKPFIDTPPARPADGLWAMLDPGCPRPDRLDTRIWPGCASPFWIHGEEATVVHALPRLSSGPRDRGYRAHYLLGSGDPLVAKIGDDADGWVFVALTDVGRNAAGRLIAAAAAPVACLAGASGAGMRLSPSRGGCETASPEEMQDAAQASVRDRASLAHLAWIASGAP